MRDKRFLYLAIWLLLVGALIELVMLLYKLETPVSIRQKLSDRLVPLYSIYGFGRAKEDFFNRPTDVAVDRLGNLYVSDTRNSRIVVMTLSGRLISIIGADGPPDVPLGLDVSDDGRIFVADRGANAVLVFNRAGLLLKSIGIKTPLAVRVAGERLYVASAGSIAVFDLEGNFLYHWGRFGRGRMEFAFPNGIAVDRDGRVFISDLNNLRVQAFGPRGDFLWVLGEPLRDPMEKQRTFGLPAGCAIGGDGNLYVVDAFQDRIVVVDPKTGEILKTFGGSRGDADGQFEQPAGIAHVSGDTFAIADKYNDRIQVVKMSIAKPGAAVPTQEETLSERNVLFVILALIVLLALVVEIRSLVGWRPSESEEMEGPVSQEEEGRGSEDEQEEPESAGEPEPPRDES